MYTYNTLLDDINYLSRCGLETGAIGASECGRLIPYIHTGNKFSQNQIIVTGAIHAREHITAYLCIRQVFALLKNDVWRDVDGGIYFVPMLNPDGNLLCAEGLSGVPQNKRALLKRINNCNDDFSLYKANANGVDLNTNFDARWGEGVQNVRSAASMSYIGPCAFSESETRAIRDFTDIIKPKCTFSYHALGQEIYWDFYQDEPYRTRDEDFVKYLNRLLGYKIIDGTMGSAGGYKDYCIDKLKIPAFTIEIVSEDYVHPLLDYDCGQKDFEKNIDLPLKALQYLCKL